jgi:hypothetical protein
MFKIQIEWTLANGKSYEEWTIPWEIAQAEKETKTTFLELFKRELPPSLEQQFWLAYQMQQQILPSRKHRKKFDRTGRHFAPAIVRVQNAFGRAGINNCRCGE